MLHYGRPGEGMEIRPGMFFTIEPMINLGRPHVKILSDGWTAVTRDRSLSAQFEHTVGITETGCEIFTLSPPAAPGRPGRFAEHRASGRMPGRFERGGTAAAFSSATASGCARASATAGADALADYELLEMAFFRAIPRRDTKPLAKALLSASARFAEVLAAPPERLKEVEGVGDGRRRRAEARSSAFAERIGAARRSEPPGALLLDRAPRLLPRRHGLSRSASSSASCSSTRRTS